MKTYPINDDQGNLIAFEIDAWRAGPEMIARLIENGLGAKITFRREWFTSEEDHLRFSYDGHDFVISESYGDNSRYSICLAETSSPNPDIIGRIQNCFEGYRPGIKGMLMGAFGI